MPLGHFEHVEAEFSLQMCGRILIIDHHVSVFFAEAWIKHRDSFTHGHTVAIIVRRVVSHRAQSEGVLIDVMGIAKQSDDKIAATDVVGQVTEQLATEGVVAQVLNHPQANE